MPSQRIYFGTHRGPLEDVVNEEVTAEYLGRTPGTEITRDRSLLAGGHMHIRGRTRSGKTSLAIAPLLAQLISGNAADPPKPPDPVFVFDMGGDLALFNLAKHYAHQCNRTFRFLSLEDGDDWHYFDPFQSVQGEGGDRLIRMCNMLVEAFHLDHGLVYGGMYFTQRNLAALLQVAKHVIKKVGKGRQPDLVTVVQYLDTHPDIKDADQIRMTFEFLLHYDQLRAAPDGEQAIDMTRAIDDGEIVYFFTPTMGEATTARQIGGLGLYNLISAAMRRYRTGANRERPRHCWVVVDEFHELAGRSFAALLAQSGKFGISLIMANQTTTQLKTRDLDLAAIVSDNTIIKQYFTVTGQDDIDALQSLSKETAILLHTQGGMSPAQESDREVLMPMLRKNHILDVSARAQQSFVIIDDGEGHSEPIAAMHEHVLTPEQYKEKKTTPLPRRGGPRPERPAPPPPPREWEQRARGRRRPKKQQQQIDSLLVAKQAEESSP